MLPGEICYMFNAPEKIRPSLIIGVSYHFHDRFRLGQYNHQFLRLAEFQARLRQVPQPQDGGGQPGLLSLHAEELLRFRHCGALLAQLRPWWVLIKSIPIWCVFKSSWCRDFKSNLEGGVRRVHQPPHQNRRGTRQRQRRDGERMRQELFGTKLRAALGREEIRCNLFWVRLLRS